MRMYKRSYWLKSLVLLSFAALATGCGGGETDSPDAAVSTADAAAADAAAADAGTEGPDAHGGVDAAAPADAAPGTQDAAATDGGPTTECPRLPAAADRVRKVVISHPYNEDASQSSSYEVLELSLEGELSTTGQQFEMGRTFVGKVLFTPDGQVGLVAQDDGTIGAFTWDDQGAPKVMHVAFDPGAGSSHLVVSATGDKLYVLEGNTRENGGGIYSVGIGCDGTLTAEGLVMPADQPQGLFLDDAQQQALVVSNDLLDSPQDQQAHIVTWGDNPELVTSSTAFPDSDAIVSEAALSSSGDYLFIADNGLPVGSRVAVVAVGAASLMPLQVVSEIADPIDVVASPFDDTALVVSGQEGNAIIELQYNPVAPTPFSAVEIRYSGDRPALPGKAALIERGSLRGLVLVAETLGVRLVRFHQGAEAEDLGAYSLGRGYEKMVGAIGVQP